MSLQLAAQHLSSQGRGPDDTLVHMSRDEVKSLNDLAMAHGGQLTTNPHTGLPEAGFLSAILPMIAGAALGPAGFELMSATQAGLAVGAGSMLLNPKAGLMGALSAGLGAYGGANLGEALAKQGMEQATAASLANKPEYLAQQEALKTAALSGNADPKTLADLAAKQYATQQGAFDLASQASPFSKLSSGVSSLGSSGGFSNLYSKLGDTGVSRLGTLAAVATPALTTQTANPPAPVADKDMGQRYTYNAGAAKPIPSSDVPTYEDMMTKQGNFGRQQNYYPSAGYQQVSADQAKSIYGFAAGGPVEQMSNNAAIGANTMYPMANMATSAFAVPYQDPRSTNMMAAMNPSGGGTVDAMSGEPNMQGTRLATGGISNAGYNLGGYSDGGRLLRGPGDGVSDSIPATIGHKQPARLADGEFVVPARIVSELGNGSTEAGARKLYGMMDRVQAARGQTVGKGKVAKNSRADKYLPA